ncbi:MAG TPA: xanthine dehydrogenase family protein molybdopterin-binding subunit [Thermomicrobiales bacterium]|nr:xanthine dehydrogenase family protein molybdopterin-binding subunit [Thermomicrobiales bacterium]
MVLSRYVGASVKRKEDPRLITGSSTYVDDIKLSGITHAVFVRSTYAHARIKGIDASAALAMPGVIDVMDGEALRSILNDFYAEKPAGDTGLEMYDPEEVGDGEIYVPKVQPLAIDKVRYIGDPIAVVVAESVEIASDAAELVVVDYEELPLVIDPYEAVKDGAPQLYAKVKNNISVREASVHGDVESAMAKAAIKVKAKIREPRCAPVSIEGRAVLAAPDPLTRGITFWSSTQAPHWNRNSIADALGLSQNQVRCIAPEVGGAFGSKIGAYPEDFVISALAFKHHRPVKWIETRSENFLSTNHGRNQWSEFEIGADENGKVVALKARVLLDSGAYPKALDLAWATWVMSTGPYKIENVDYEVIGAYTNTMANGAYRGAGRPEATFYLERLMDMVADEGGLDPTEVRKVNFIPPEEFPFMTLTGESYDSGEHQKALDKAKELIGYDALRAEQAKQRKDGRYLGIGVASYVEICGFGPFESSTVRVEKGGAVTIYTGISPHGQGQETTFSQLAAEYLGADFDTVEVFHGDTANTPQGNGTMGSRGLATGGAALMMSLDKLRDKSSKIAAHILEASAEDIELKDGKYQVKGVPDRSVTLAEIADKAYSDDLPEGMEPGLDTTDFFKVPEETFPFGSHIAVVEVFPETGEIELVRYVSVDDCGNIISPNLVTGQVHGGLAQGIGQVLWEELHYDSNGELLTGTLNDYAIPKAEFFPLFETHHTTTPTYINPMGAKGIGEAATIGSTPATANAVIDALEPFGITHLDTPFTPEKVWRAVESATTSASAAD